MLPPGKSAAQDIRTTGVDMGAHALAYTLAGHAVFPLHTPRATGCSCGARDCSSLGKHPRTRNGLEDATTDAERVGEWWRKWPDANIGIRPAEGMAVLDVDTGRGKRGASNLLAFAAGLGTLPATWTAHTGGGGLHAWYLANGDLRGHVCEHVDIKTSRGYLVAPPSLHASGRRYEWANDLPIATLPDRWVKALRKPTLLVPRPMPPGAPLGASADGLVRFVADAQPGQRNSSLHWAACRAAEKGAPPELLNRLRDAAESIGLSPVEIGRTIASALRGTAVAA